MLVAAVLSAWLQYAADGEPHARAVVGDAACPAASADGRTLPMTERARRIAQFGDVVCDVAVPPGAKRVRVAERELPAPAHDPRTIVVLGDTGCRISALSAQSCNDPAAWPFPQIARAIAAVHPDLVVHVGDYLYRERPCPPLARCADSPFGDDAGAWYADFLTPAAPLFAAAPLLVMRGNHEECDRNGAGWFRYLDAHATTACSNATEPYAVELGDLRIVAFDSAVAEDRAVDPARTAVYKNQFAAVRELARGPSWFVTHRPPYTNDDERAAMGDALTPFDAVLAGHVHLFAAMNVESLPPLLINGEGGTKLDPNYAALLRFAVGELHVQGSVFGSAHFGFGVYTRGGAGWTISLRDPDGTERARCALAHRAVSCNPEK
jgi:Calcineurin-like phosphoesterase